MFVLIESRRTTSSTFNERIIDDALVDSDHYPKADYRQRSFVKRVRGDVREGNFVVSLRCTPACGSVEAAVARVFVGGLKPAPSGSGGAFQVAKG